MQIIATPTSIPPSFTPTALANALASGSDPSFGLWLLLIVGIAAIVVLIMATQRRQSATR